MASRSKSKPKPKRYCVGCGNEGPFPNATTTKCKACTKTAVESRREYQRHYQLARSRAIKTLINAHRDEYEDLLHDECAVDEVLIAASERASRVLTGA